MVIGEMVENHNEKNCIDDNPHAAYRFQNLFFILYRNANV